jgi:L-ascorbate metabolism protein UlaG (beta-lactamase superfamily)
MVQPCSGGPEHHRHSRSVAEAFEAANMTVLRWLGMAGFLINSRGTTLMVDPLLGGLDMPVMIEFPTAAADVGRRAGHAQRQRPLQRAYLW